METLSLIFLIFRTCVCRILVQGLDRSLSLSFLLLPYAASQALNREHDTSSRKLNVAQRTTGRDIAISSSYMARRLCKLSRSVCSSILWNARLGRTRVESIHHLCFDSRVRQIFWGGDHLFARIFSLFFPFPFLSFFFFGEEENGGSIGAPPLSRSP